MRAFLSCYTVAFTIHLRIYHVSNLIFHTCSNNNRGVLFAVLHEFNHRETKEKERKDKKRK
jgi:hypothetical protein